MIEFGSTLLDQARDAILVRDLEDHVRYWNQGATRLYGWTPEEALGRKVTELLEMDVAAFAAGQAQVEQHGEWIGEITVRSRDGRDLIVESRWTLVRDAAGAPAAVLVIDTDITERKRLEAAYLRAQRMESIGTLAGGIAHDLNNVLTPIAMSIDILREAVSDAGSLEILDTIETSTRHGADLVRQVLTFARGMEGRRTAVGVRQLVQDVAYLARGTLSKAVAITTEVAGDVASVIGEPTQLHQVLLNLVVNARDAMPDGGVLTLGARNVQFDQHHAAMGPRARPGRYVALFVRDDGQGISPGIQERIFEPFFTTKEVGKGTGLGLSTALSIVRSHGGFITLSSESGKGTTFTVHLPVGEVVEALGGTTPGDLPRGRGELVLLVDDEDAVRSITQQALEANGYRVLAARDGAEAVAMYVPRRAEIGVVLTDVMMPVMDGIATAHALRRINPQVRIVAASGLNAAGSETRLAEEGVRRFLPKPYTPETLLRTLRAALDDA